MLFRKHFVRKILFFLLFSLTGLPQTAFAIRNDGEEGASWETEVSPEITDATQAAQHFLNLIEAFNYSGSWLDAGALLKDIITQDQWVAAMNGMRARRGELRTRKIESRVPAYALPFGTKGDFIIIRFRSEFTRAPKTIETLYLFRESRFNINTWKVVHYNVGTE